MTHKYVIEYDGINGEREFANTDRLIINGESADNFVPVIHAKWILDIDNQDWCLGKPYRCSNCGEWSEDKYKYCHCGAKMEVEE